MGNDILQAIPTLEKDIPADQFMVQEFWIPLAWACGVLIPLAVLAAWWLYRRNRKKAAPGMVRIDRSEGSFRVELEPDLEEKLSRS